MKRDSRWEQLSRAVRQLGRSFRLAVFGRGRPRRVVREAIMTSTSEIDPAKSDPRAVLPEEPPQEVGGPGTPASHHVPDSGPAGRAQGHDELHIPRD